MEQKIRNMKPVLDTSSPKKRPHQSMYYGSCLAHQQQLKQDQDKDNFLLYNKLTDAYTRPSPYNQTIMKPKTGRPRRDTNEAFRQKQAESAAYIESIQKASSPRKNVDPNSPQITYSPFRNIESVYKRQDQERDYVKNQEQCIQKCLFKPVLTGLVDIQKNQVKSQKSKLLKEIKFDGTIKKPQVVVEEE
ncbi:Hypothetical_protein [Hexamita inflata]|uniref:Hypothetical_protein n=1 Tax=Hexamita inflata TaxID=28002 RepID=A0AA86PQA1_9EUKA|nr:Hypothetical protein HINF_LOCUS27160 [Hexamita inflata]